MPLLSLITINRNTADSVLETLKSIEAQGFHDFEHILIDGDSEDQSLEHLKSYAKAPKPYSVQLISERDEGIYDAMNKGLALTSGEYVFFLNVGDRFEQSSSLEAWAKQVQLHNSPNFLLTGVLLKHSPTQYEWRRYPEVMDSEFWIREYLCHQAFFCKTKWLKKIGGFEKSYSIAADFDLFLKAWVAQKKWTVISDPIAVFAMDGASNSESKRLSILKDFNRIQKKHLGLLTWFLYKLRAKVDQGADVEPRTGLRFLFRMIRILFSNLIRYENKTKNTHFYSKSGVAPRKKVLHINSHLFSGGAARACYRLHQSLTESSNEFVSHVAVMKREFADGVIEFQAPFKLGFSRVFYKFHSLLEAYLLRYFYKNDRVALVSPALAGIVDLDRLLKSEAPDIVHLHWTCAQTLSLEDFETLKSYKTLWTFHDQWPLGGGEHVLGDERYATGYTQSSKNKWEHGFDMNRWIWNRKRDAFSSLNKCQIVTPSRSMTEMAKKSLLWSKHSIEQIPHGLDFRFWKPMDMKVARLGLDLDPEGVYFLFGAMDVLSDSNKGFDLLYAALQQVDVSKLSKKPTLLLVGYYGKNPFEKLQGWDVVQLGLLQSDRFLRQVYAASDLILLPSRVESFGLMALEAQACGCPVVCFDTTGLQDVVEHEVSGYRAKAFDPRDFAVGIIKVFLERDSYSKRASLRAQNLFPIEKTRECYEGIYRKLLREQNE